MEKPCPRLGLRMEALLQKSHPRTKIQIQTLPRLRMEMQKLKQCPWPRSQRPARLRKQ
ncbi:hypothetical protein NFI96_019289, partial [Prochilodus magdalenae]